MEKNDYSKLYRGVKSDFDEVYYMTVVSELIAQIRKVFDSKLLSAHAAQNKIGIKPNYSYSMERKLLRDKLDRNKRIYMNGAVDIKYDYKKGDCLVLTPYGEFSTGIDMNQLYVGNDIDIKYDFEQEIDKLVKTEYRGKDFSRDDNHSTVARDKTMASDVYSILLDENKKPTIFGLPKMLKEEKAHLQDVLDLVNINYVTADSYSARNNIIPGSESTYRVDGKDYSLSDMQNNFPMRTQAIKDELEIKLGIKEPLVKENVSVQNLVSNDAGREM